MAPLRGSARLASLIFSILSFFIASVQAQAPAPAPFPSSIPSPAIAGDGSSIDLGVAYTLMFMALVLTYLMHPIDAFPFNLF